jgi:uncharacterized membrane protein (DUF485 family)
MSAQTGHPTATESPPRTDGQLDWRHLANTREFQALHRSRRRFTLVGMAIETAALLVVMGLYGWAPDAMGKPAIGSVTWALLSGAGLILLTFVMAWAYARKAREWEELSARAVEHSEGTIEPTGRFTR